MVVVGDWFVGIVATLKSSGTSLWVCLVCHGRHLCVRPRIPLKSILGNSKNSCSRLYVFINSSSYILKIRSGIRPPATTLTALALVPRVQYPYDPHAVISRLGVVDLNGDDVSGSLLRFRGRE